MEAAYLDGASLWKLFRHVIAPLLRPILVYQLVVSVIGTVQIFTEFFLMQGPGYSTRTLAVYTYQLGFQTHGSRLWSGGLHDYLPVADCGHFGSVAALSGDFGVLVRPLASPLAPGTALVAMRGPDGEERSMSTAEQSLSAGYVAAAVETRAMEILDPSSPYSRFSLLSYSIHFSG